MANVQIKTEEEIDVMRESGRLLAMVFDYLDSFIKVGVSTLEINDLVESYITNQLHARPASKGQYGYQYVLNSSLNDVVCHGIPSEKQKLKQVVNKYQQRAWQQAEQQTTQMTKLLADNGMIISPVSDSLSQSLKIVGANMAQEWALNATQSELHVLQKFKEQQNAQ